jgi:hypothetical protein
MLLETVLGSFSERGEATVAMTLAWLIASNSHSTLLKSDQWLQETEYTPNGVRGASSFRNIEGTNIYACGQPTADAIDEVVDRVRKDWPDAGDMVWITLREEPIIVINGAPYCLRRESYSLRNMKASSDSPRRPF